ncbi:GTP-binding protein Rho1 [Tulasnella sp. 424]|nr:GTP-binding protein Rho1 [Tulasnella sp. 424]
MSEIRRKLVIVGDGACGKTCLLIVFSKGTFPEVYVPTVFENYVADVEVDGKHVELALWDTAGQEDYDRLRPLSYPDSHVILICFAVDSPDSLDNVQEKWISEVHHFCQGLPVILVGCKKDLRRDPKTIEDLKRTGQRPVTSEEGMAVAQKIGAKHYLECSAKTGEGVREVFQYATRAALLSRAKKPSKGGKVLCATENGVDVPPSLRAELLSPTPSAASLTATHTPEDIYYDPRDEPGPSRYVRAVVSQAGLGGVPARSTDGLHCAVACKDYLKILRITEPGSPASLGGEFARPPSRRSKQLATGPEGATIYDEITIRMGQNTLSTDVSWGHANNANKIVVTSRSGDILIVDAIKGKLERTIKEHTRSVNGVAFTPHLPNWFATCSQDGYVKLWDMRTNLDVSSVSINHRIATQCIAFSPSASTRWHAVVALENGGFYKWDYKAKGVGLLDRYTAAHNGAILGMDWVGPNAGTESQGWLCTGGMDKTVWDMSQGLQEQKPPHVLHTAEKVKKLAWRPGHDCEVAIVPQTPGLSADGGETADADRIEIWDVRRPWLPKYVLEGGEGSVVGMVWAGPDVLWATYSNGSLVQHDLRECYRPLDSLPRSALAWDPSGAVTWATETVSSSEIPYDDVRPSLKPQLIHSGWKDKTPADPDYNAANQTIATATLPLFDTKGFVELARGYMLAPNPDTGEDVEAGTLEQVCMVNAEVAHQAEYYRAAQTWLVLRSLLSPVTAHEPQDQERDELSASPSPIPVSPRTQASSVARHAPTPPLPPLSGGRPPVRLHDRRSVSTSSVFQFQRPLPAVAAQLTAKSSDNSPASDNRRGYPIGNGAPPPQTNPLTRPTISRRSSTATKVSKSSGGRRKGSGSQDRRNYSKDRGRSASIGSPSRSRASSMAASKQIGDGAFEDCSSEDDVPGVPEPRYIRHSSRSSLASNTLEVPDEEDERSLRSSSQTASSGSSMKNGVPPLLFFDDNSDDAGMMADDNYDSSTSSGRDSFKVPAPPSSPVASTLLPLDRPKITKQDSRSSIRTAVPSNSRSRALSGAADRGRPQASSSGNDTAGKTKPTVDPYLTLGSSTDGELDGSTRRPSPASSGTERPRHLRTDSYTGVSMKPTEEPILEVPSPHIHSHRLNSNSTSPHPSTEHTPLIRDVASLGHTERVPSYGTSSKFGIAATISDHEEDERGRSLLRKHQNQAPIDPVAVMEEEERMRKIGWDAMREAFEYYREMGDVQMCTALATVARGELLSVEESATLDRLSSAYVDILTRLRLHTEAASILLFMRLVVAAANLL